MLWCAWLLDETLIENSQVTDIFSVAMMLSECCKLRKSQNVFIIIFYAVYLLHNHAPCRPVKRKTEFRLSSCMCFYSLVSCSIRRNMCISSESDIIVINTRPISAKPWHNNASILDSSLRSESGISLYKKETIAAWMMRRSLVNSRDLFCGDDKVIQQ